MTATTTTYPRLQALYIPMHDGVRIAIDVWLPEGLAVGARVPAVMRATRYWRSQGVTDRSLEADSNFAGAQLYNGAGYAYVVVDVRGTGASFGTSHNPWTPDEIADLGEVVNWIAARDWSNGRAGTVGISYDGNTAEFAAVGNPPALKAIVPRFSDFDPYAQVFAPGGVVNEWMMVKWGEAVHLMDLNDICALRGVEGEACDELLRTVTGVKPVDADPDGRLLAAAVDSHVGNAHVGRFAQELTYRDDVDAASGDTPEAWSPYIYREEIERSGVAIQAWASWLDAGTAAGVLGRFNTFSNPQQVFIGPWSHGAGHPANPFAEPGGDVQPPIAEQHARILAFFDQHLKDDAPPAPPARELHYFTFGDDAWKTTDVWPPAGATTEHWYLADSGGLSLEPPASEDGADDFDVDYTATTGEANRWFTQMGGAPVVCPDRADQAGKVLAYRGAPLEDDLEITGHPVVTVYLTSSADDSALFAYLEAVDPDGRVTYLTEGHLRAMHRAVSDDPPYWTGVPYHSCARAAAQPLVPGEQVELVVPLYPTSVLLRRGQCLQVSLAGHDAGWFARLLATGTPRLTVARNRLHASCVDVPVVRHFG